MNYSISVKDTIITIACAGSLTGQDLSASALLSGDPAMRRNNLTGVLVDMSEVTDIEIDISTMEDFATGLLQVVLPHEIKVALVAGTPMQYSYAESFRILSDHPQLEIQVFRKEKDALGWLLNDPDDNIRSSPCGTE